MQEELHLNVETSESPRNIVERFWQQMASNDFFSVQAVLSGDFVLEWPQSGERIRGGENFAKMNAEYTAHGRWMFALNNIVCDGAKVVTDVSVTDSVQQGRAISFFTVSNGKIQKIIEFWPDPFPAPENRQHLVEMMTHAS
ncbi:nuclear transport factor 2 family protein [Undibacterium sp.]|uniref:nuclear transport factor 2 family protein n=1 Tax=Undibacterium sp. TaxID=1914977 RepID=UPI0037517F6F